MRLSAAQCSTSGNRRRDSSSALLDSLAYFSLIKNYGYYHPDKSLIYWTLDSQGSPLTFSIHVGRGESRRDTLSSPVCSSALSPTCWAGQHIPTLPHSSQLYNWGLEVGSEGFAQLMLRSNAVFDISCLNRGSSARVIGQSPLAPWPAVWLVTK